MKEFNTSGPNIPLKHYTVERKLEIKRGLELVRNDRYFTIWAPRQTGKSTYFRQLADKLEIEGYKVAHINFENYKDEPLYSFLGKLSQDLEGFWGIEFSNMTIGEIFQKIANIKDKKYVLIIDEVEGINEEYFGTFLHSIRNAYHSRETHSLKSVILVGVSNIVGVVSDNASPFNIADNLNVPYFTDDEVFELLGQHTIETGQQFEKKVIEKISQITANQPGLVNGFALQLVERNPDQKILTYNNYFEVEDWYLNKAIDKNISNILNKAYEHRKFVESLLFTPNKIPFKINTPAIKYLHTNGLIKDDDEGNVIFWVPLYKKAVYDAFYPFTNGEQDDLLRRFVLGKLFDDDKKLKLDYLIDGYKEYVKRRGFNVFREKDENGEYKSIKESAMTYSFETYVQAFLLVVGGKSYREADTGLGKSDLIINVNSEEYLIETKIYYYERQFLEGKEQLAYYCKSLGLDKGVYLVFYPNDIPHPQVVKEQRENIDGIELITYLIPYDIKKWK